MSHQPVAAAVIFVADVTRVARFYRELAAMKLLNEDDDHQVLEVNGFQLVIHRLHGEPEPSVPVRVREDSYIKFCLPVESIAEARRAAEAFGGAIRGVEAEWQARGFRACDGHDPEGNVIQVRELCES